MPTWITTKRFDAGEYTSVSTITNTMTWNTAATVGLHARRILLYGPPGTGKSYLGRRLGLKRGRKIHPVMIHSDLPAAELRGHFIPQEKSGKQVFVWRDGPAVAAWRDGGCLVLDEIDKAGDDALSFLLAILDDDETALLEIGTTNEILSPHEDFFVVATMNGTPEDLPPALIDRFPVSIKITGPHPDAVAALKPEYRKLATDDKVKDGVRQLGIRTFLEYQKLMDAGVGEESAAMACFGSQADAVLNAIRQARKADIR